MKILQIVEDDGAEITEKYVLLSETECRDYLQQSIDCPKMTLKQVGKWLHKSPAWLTKNILDIPRFRKKLDVIHGGCVYYGTGQGSSYEIEPVEFSKFIQQNFADIWKNAKKVTK